MKKTAAILLMLCLAAALTACTASDYKAAESLIAEEDWDGAREILEELGDYKDSALLLKKCDYGDAEYYMGRKKWSKARAILEELAEEGFEDSAELLEACCYEEAVEKMEEGDFEAATELLKKAGSGKKVKEMLDAVLYKQAVEAYEDGRFDEAEELFLQIRDYMDAAAYLDSLVVIRAEQYYDEDKYEEVLKILEGRTDDDSLELYEDAFEDWVEDVFFEEKDYEKCLWIVDTYALVKKQEYKLLVAEKMAALNQEYEAALDILKTLDDSEEVKELYQAIFELWVVELYDGENGIEACLDAIKRFCTEEDTLKYKALLAEGLCLDERFEEALELLKTFGDETDSVWFDNAKVNLADWLCENERFEEALELLDSLENDEAGKEFAEDIRRYLMAAPILGDWAYNMDITEMFYQMFANQMSDERVHFTELCGGKSFCVPMILTIETDGSFAFQPVMSMLEERLENSLPMLENGFYASFQEMVLNTLRKNGYPDVTWEQVLSSYQVTNTADCFTAYVGTTAEQCIRGSFSSILDYYSAYGTFGTYDIEEGKLLLTDGDSDSDLPRSYAYTAEEAKLTLNAPDGEDILDSSYPMTLYRPDYAPDWEAEPGKEPEADGPSVADKFLGEWQAANPESGKTYVTIEFRQGGIVVINGKSYSYTIGTYSTEADPEVYVDLGTGEGYELALYSSYPPIDLYFYHTKIDSDGIHTVGDGIEYVLK